MQEVLVDGGQLVFQDRVETLDDSGIAFHVRRSARGFGIRKRTSAPGL
jgi:hypothetical protein